MQPVSPGNLHRHVFALNVLYARCKGLVHVATVTQQTLLSAHTALAKLERGRRTLTRHHHGCTHCQRMRQALAIHRDMRLDARDLLACLMACVAGSTRVLYALCANARGSSLLH